MISHSYYNEWEPFAAQWLRNLIARGLIAPGDVDERSIKDVQADDLRGYTQVHFFAGIGGWSHALRLAGWDDERPVWTGSCPCQPFSAAGRGLGADDERHLWPAFHKLISECRPATVFGEQVASALGRQWLAAVRADLEALEYAVGAADLCAAGAGAPHIRQRLWFVADAKGGDGGLSISERGPQQDRAQFKRGGKVSLVAGSIGSGLEKRDGERCVQRAAVGTRAREAAECGGHAGGLGDASGARRFGAQPKPERETRHETRMPVPRAGCRYSHWSAADWLPCRDGKARPVEPGTFPLAYGISGRVGRLRAYGNAIVPQVAAEFIAAYMECRP